MSVLIKGLFKRQLYALTLSAFIGSVLVRKLVQAIIVPKHLRHIPKVNTLQWFWSVVIGESHDVRTRRLMLPLMNKHGLCLKYVMGTWALTVADPVYLQMLLKDIEMFPKLQDLILTNNEPNMGNASVAVWKRQRSVANPAFHRAMPVETFAQVVLRMFESIDKHHPDGVIDAVSYMKRYTLDCLGLGIFDFDMQTVSDPNSCYAIQYKEAFSIVRDPFVYLFPAYTYLPSRLIPYRNRARKANENLRQLLQDIIKKKKESPSTKSNPDLLSLMIMATNHDKTGKEYLTDGELVSNIAVFFVAGKEHTFATSSFLYYLATHPNIQEKARKEVLSVLGDDPEDIIPTDKELKQMDYLNNCIKETMRINPPTSGNLPRVASRDTHIGNIFIPKGTMINLELYSAHHLDKYWDLPEVFNPDRFNTGSPGYREKATWMPFGYGPRTCIGLNFSMYEQRVLMAMFLKKYTWKLVPNSEHEHGLKNAVGGGIGLLGPESLRIILTKRYP
ncbi:cytochrome P450 [Rhizopus microsporus var. microsporus]|uniref:Cytochrome P450 n=1 Tax=Rhizopus microsporus var. microsporus TaxID=86635 RepID=A0A1X0QNE5_RHIZD|nr:cytochrome P450 [Rhizopus microsporus var. microsporus]